jgi:cytosine deaminase
MAIAALPCLMTIAVGDRQDGRRICQYSDIRPVETRDQRPLSAAVGPVCAKLEAMDAFLQAAIDEARTGLADGGIPIGSVLVIDGEIVGRGHNQRVQRGSAILHAEMDCLENAGRLQAADYRRAVLYSTLSPCDMCSGAILLYGILKVVVGENRTFQGPEDHLRSRGVEIRIVDDPTCGQLMEDFIAARPELWNEDIGE